jgi:hypothetical protein
MNSSYAVISMWLHQVFCPKVWHPIHDKENIVWISFTLLQFFKMTCTNSTNDTIIIDEISSGFGAFGALVCLILGTGANSWALLTMITRPKARNQPLSPLVFYLSISYFFFCIFCLPLVLMRFIYRENIVEHLGKVIEFQVRLGLGIISISCCP